MDCVMRNMHNAVNGTIALKPVDKECTELLLAFGRNPENEQWVFNHRRCWFVMFSQCTFSKKELELIGDCRVIPCLCLSLYRTAGNFREAEIFAIFTIQRPLAKICSREKFLPVKIRFQNAFLHFFTLVHMLQLANVASSLLQVCGRPTFPQGGFVDHCQSGSH